MKTKIFATTDPVDEKNLSKYIESLKNQKLNKVHFDVMDGLFVDAKKITPKTIISLTNKFDTIKFDAHLMVLDPTKFIKKLSGAKLNNVFAHIESFNDKNSAESFIAECKNFGFNPSVAISPKTKLSSQALNTINLFKNVLILGVIPGKSGQKLIPQTLKKVTQLKKFNNKIKIYFDGGINDKNFAKLLKLGVDAICFGSFMFKLNAENSVENFLKKI